MLSKLINLSILEQEEIMLTCVMRHIAHKSGRPAIFAGFQTKSFRLGVSARTFRTLSSITTTPDNPLMCKPTALLPAISQKLNSSVGYVDYNPQRRRRFLPYKNAFLAASWVTLDESASKVLTTPVITGPILPFSQMNFLQKIILPYTFVVMYYMDFLLGHLPWYLAIAGTTVTVRLLCFPLVLKHNKMGIKVYNILPKTQKIQEEINEGMATGDGYKVSINKTKLALLYRDHGVGTWERLWPTLVQAPAFMSMFLLINRLSREPIESMVTGGALWFTNLTLPDPFFILPLMTSASFYFLIAYGIEGSATPIDAMGPIGKWIFRIMPIGLFAFTYNFPAAVLLFWTTNNFMTLFYAILLRQSFVKKLFNIPNRLKHDPADLPLSNLSMVEQYKKAVDKGTAKKTTLDVRRLDDLAFRRAGVGPLKKTYKTPPAKSVE